MNETKSPVQESILKRSTQRSTERSKISWALYDWANSAFATTVMAGFFPLFFKGFWSQDLNVTTSTYWLGVSTSVTSLFLAIISPLLGTIADQRHAKKFFLMIFTLLGASSTMALAWVPQGAWMLSLGLYCLATVGFTAALTFYDALLVHVSNDKQVHAVSALGYSLGYLGGGILFAFNVWMYLSPSTFFIATGVEAVQWSFVTVGVWWLLFTLPLLIFVSEPRGLKLAQGPSASMIGAAFVELKGTASRLLQNRPLALFLFGYLFYIDGVNTTVRMAVDYGMSIGLESKDLISALLIVQFIGFPSALLFGWLGSRAFAFAGILLCLLVYCGVAVAAFFLTTGGQFYFLAVAIGLVQGGIQSLSRSVFAELVPKDRSGEFFGFFNMIGKFSAILGPLLVGLISAQTGEPRYSILVLLLFFVVGGGLAVASARARRQKQL